MFLVASVVFGPNRQGLKNKPTASLQRGKTPPTSVPVGYGCRIHRLYLYKRVRLPQRVALLAMAAEYTDCFSDSFRYDTKQFDGEASVMLKLWEMQHTPFCHRSQVHSGPDW